jgi:hypothetical protein
MAFEFLVWRKLIISLFMFKYCVSFLFLPCFRLLLVHYHSLLLSRPVVLSVKQFSDSGSLRTFSLWQHFEHLNSCQLVGSIHRVLVVYQLL